MYVFLLTVKLCRKQQRFLSKLACCAVVTQLFPCRKYKWD
jgi:hypothetical protein